MRTRCFGTVIVFLALLAALPLKAQQVAPGAPGDKPAWTNGNKVGVGTSTTPNSKVWFTLGQNGALHRATAAPDRAAAALKDHEADPEPIGQRRQRTLRDVQLPA